MHSPAFRKPNLIYFSVLALSLCCVPLALSQTQSPAQPSVLPQPQQGVGAPPPVGPPPGRVQPPVYNCEPVNPNATPEARALLKRLCSLSGNGILTGHHNRLYSFCNSASTASTSFPVFSRLSILILSRVSSSVW